MKKLFSVLLFLPIWTVAQADKEKFEFTLVDSTDGTKSELFIHAKSWITSTFVSAKAVIELEDKEAGKIIGKGIISFPVRATLGNKIGEDDIHFTITIDLKDSRYRCVFSDFYHKGGGYNGSGNGGSLDDDKPDCGTFIIPKKRWQSYKDQTSEKCRLLLASFNTSMKSGRANSDF